MLDTEGAIDPMYIRSLRIGLELGEIDPKEKSASFYSCLVVNMKHSELHQKLQEAEFLNWLEKLVKFLDSSDLEALQTRLIEFLDLDPIMSTGCSDLLQRIAGDHI